MANERRLRASTAAACLLLAQRALALDDRRESKAMSQPRNPRRPRRQRPRALSSPHRRHLESGGDFCEPLALTSVRTVGTSDTRRHFCRPPLSARHEREPRKRQPADRALSNLLTKTPPLAYGAGRATRVASAFDDVCRANKAANERATAFCGFACVFFFFVLLGDKRRARNADETRAARRRES